MVDRRDESDIITDINRGSLRRNGDMGVIETVPHVNIADDYRLMVEQVLPELGFKEPEALFIPSLEEVQLAINPQLANWLIERSTHGTIDRLVIAPKVGGDRGIGVRNLIDSFDPAAYSDGYVWQDLWGNGHSDKNYPKAHKNNAAIHNNGPKETWQVAILLGDTTDISSGRQAYDPGLMHTGQIVRDQAEAVKAERTMARQQGVELLSVPIGHLVVDAAGLRAQGQAQRRGVSRLVHYSSKPVGAYSCVPDVGADGSRLGFDGSSVGYGWGDVGARRVVRVPVKLEA